MHFHQLIQGRSRGGGGSLGSEELPQAKNAVSTAPAPVGRAFGLKYRLADLLQTISRASSRFTRASSRFTRQ